MKQIARPLIPSFGTKKELFSYLIANAQKIIAEKKSFPIKSDDFQFGYVIKEGHTPIISGFKKAQGEATQAPEMKAGELAVDVYANVAGWCDSYNDVMIKDNWNKSINDIGVSGEKIMYHLKNHSYSTDSIIAKDASLYSKMVDTSIFNITTDIKKVQALMMSSIVMEEYDRKCFLLYRDGQIKQHSIGLQYIKLYLCLNSDEPEDAQFKDNWDKYYSQVINKEKVDKSGYFWAVTESKIIEVSVVLYGANELTPTESAKGEHTSEEPPAGTPEKHLQSKAETRWEKMALSFES